VYICRPSKWIKHNIPSDSRICEFVWVGLCMCPHSKRKMAWAINTKPILHGRTWADIDPEVRDKGHKVIKHAAGMGMHVNMTAQVSCFKVQVGDPQQVYCLLSIRKITSPVKILPFHYVW